MILSQTYHRQAATTTTCVASCGGEQRKREHLYVDGRSQSPVQLTAAVDGEDEEGKKAWRESQSPVQLTAAVDKAAIDGVQNTDGLNHLCS